MGLGLYEYPFNSKFFTLKSGLKYHYIDEGVGPILLCVHGNPTWSYYYRNIITDLSKRFRVIAVDHIGCGLSDHAKDFSYTLENHINNLDEFIKAKELKDITLLMHDWGGPIATGAALKNLNLIKGMIFLNTSVFIDKNIPKRINILRTKLLGPFFIQAFNLFAWPATFMTTKHKLNQKIKSGYLYPYQSYDDRLAVSEFVQDIPMSVQDRSYQTLKNIEDSLAKLNAKKLILWGGLDFCFSKHFYFRLKEKFPEAKSVLYEDAGHYVLEDKRFEVADEILNFIQ